MELSFSVEAKVIVIEYYVDTSFFRSGYRRIPRLYRAKVFCEQQVELSFSVEAKLTVYKSLY